MKTETIAAIATALSDAGIGIIRISGNEAIEVVDRIFVTKDQKHILKNIKSHTIHYGFLFDGEELIDEVMVSVMKAPKSYTTEDTVEINCHGGILMSRKVLSLVLQNGARLAEPGEFTKRAFLNGRIDLSKAEAVMDVIHSENELFLKSSVSQLRGSLSSSIRSLREKILYEIAFIESAIDDPEHISLEGYSERLSGVLNELLSSLQGLVDSFDTGKLLREGIRTVILGKPNAGKSSFLNLLVGEDKAIVTDVAGTTRDALEEYVKVRGVSLKVIDTAGIRSTDDVVEKIGVEKAIRFANDADLILYVVDSSRTFDENDHRICEMIRDKRSIILYNKTDLHAAVTEDEIFEHIGKKFPLIRVSATENVGLDEFERLVKEMFFEGKISSSEEIYVTNIRHKEAICESIEALKLVKKSLDDDMPEDFYSIDLMHAYTSLGFVIGEEVGEDLVDEIFSKFCMGK